MDIRRCIDESIPIQKAGVVNRFYYRATSSHTGLSHDSGQHEA